MADEIKASETPATPAPETETVDSAVEVGKDGKPFDAERAQSTIEKLRAELKEAKGKAKRVDELEAIEKQRKDAELSEVERLQKRLAEAETQAREFAKRQAQRDAAEKVGLPLTFAARLQGDSPEQLEADAKTLLEAMPKPTAKTNTTNPNSGAVSETDAERARRLGLRI